MTRLRQLIQTQPWLVIGFAFMITILLVSFSALSIWAIRAYLLEEVGPDQPAIAILNTNTTATASDDAEPTTDTAELPPNTDVAAYLFSSYGYNCRTGTVGAEPVNHIELELNFSEGTISGGCHLTYQPSYAPDSDHRVDYNIEGTLTPEGVITAKVIDGTYTVTNEDGENEIDWGLSGDFTGTVDLATMKVSGEYVMTIEKHIGGTGNNPEVEHLQWIARPVATDATASNDVCPTNKTFEVDGDSPQRYCECPEGYTKESGVIGYGSCSEGSECPILEVRCTQE